MPKSATPTGFSIPDLLTRIIPGGVLVFSIFSPVILPEYLPDLSIQNSEILAFTVISFLAGEVINTGRISFFDVPNHFCRVLYTENGRDEMYLRWPDTYLSTRYPEYVEGYSLFEHSDKDIAGTLRNRFNLDSDFDGPHNLFMLLTSDLSSAKSPETQRLENIYIFYENMKYSAVISLLWQIVFIGYTALEITPQTETGIAFALLIAYSVLILTYLVILLLGQTVSVDRAYVESLLSDYFTYTSNTSQTSSK
jgi:hypothetical protein